MKRLLFIALFAGSSLYAALPPLAQSMREIEALIGDSQLYELLGSAEQIKDIIRTEGGYAVLTQNYLVRVNIFYTSTGKMVGPAAFKFEFHQPVDLKTGELKL